MKRKSPSPNNESAKRARLKHGSSSSNSNSPGNNSSSSSNNNNNNETNVPTARRSLQESDNFGNFRFNGRKIVLVDSRTNPPRISIRFWDGKKYYRIPRNRFDIQSYEKFLKVYEKDIQGKEEELLEGLKNQERNGDSRCRATATTHDNNNCNGAASTTQKLHCGICNLANKNGTPSYHVSPSGIQKHCQTKRHKQLAKDFSNNQEVKLVGCRNCGFDNNDAKMLICQGYARSQNKSIVECNNMYHIGCLHPCLQSVPEGDWVCPLCLRTAKNDHEIAHKILSEIKNPDACIQNEMQALHDALNGVGRNNSRA